MILFKQDFSPPHFRYERTVITKKKNKKLSHWPTFRWISKLAILRIQKIHSSSGVVNFVNRKYIKSLLFFFLENACANLLVISLLSFISGIYIVHQGILLCFFYVFILFSWPISNILTTWLRKFCLKCINRRLYFLYFSIAFNSKQFQL